MSLLRGGLAVMCALAALGVSCVGRGPSVPAPDPVASASAASVASAAPEASVAPAASGGWRVRSEVATGPVDLGDPAARPLLASLERTRQRLAPEAASTGDALVGKIAEGQSLEMRMTARPGFCYSFFAAGPEETALQLEVLLEMPPMPVTRLALSEPGGAGRGAELAVGKNCLKMPVPLPMQLTLRVAALRGSGLVAAQVFAR